MAKRRSEILTWARQGAESRLKELTAEIDAILRAFPGIRTGRSASRQALPPRRRRLSAAGRKAISDAAKRRWKKYRENA